MNDSLKRNLKVAILVGVPSLPSLWLGGWIVWGVTFLLYYCLVWLVVRFGSMELWTLIITLGITEDEYVALKTTEQYKKTDDKVARWLLWGGKKPRYQSKDVISLDATCRLN